MNRHRLAAVIAITTATTLSHVAAASAATSEASSPHHHYVVDTVKFGSNVNEADTYGFDLNNDDNHGVDNAIGQVFAGLSNQIDADESLASTIGSGSSVLLPSLRTVSFVGDRPATFRIYRGQPQAHPVLTGGGHFSLDPNAPQSAPLTGQLHNGLFTATSGTVALPLGLIPGKASVLHIRDAHVQANCVSYGCFNGKVGGGVSTAEVNNIVTPTLAYMIQQVIAASCTAATPDDCSDQAQRLLDVFDANHDYVVTTAELRKSALIRGVLSPDLDLLDATGNPGYDGVNDSLSIGIGFSARDAVFDAQNEH